MFQTEFAGIFMSSLPETQSSESFDAGGSTQEQDDVFHTPPEKSSFPTSREKPLDHYTAFNESLEFVDFGDSQGAGSVNLERDSDLGFWEVQLTERDERELVSWSPRGIKRDGVDEDNDELQVKKSKISEPQSGSDFSRAYLGIESLKPKRVMRIAWLMLNFCKLFLLRNKCVGPMKSQYWRMKDMK